MSNALFSKTFFFVLFAWGAIYGGYGQTSSSLVYLQNGQLQYDTFAMSGQSNAVNTIPDYSFAGYQRGGVALPDVPVVATLSPITGDDGQNIQDAIDSVEALSPDANGFRGTILLTAGEYEVAGQLFIEASGVVLRGEGQGSAETVIKANQQVQADFLFLQGTGSGIVLDTNSTQGITSSYVPVGAYSFEVANASGFAVGDTIAVRRTPNQFWIDDLNVGQYGWTAASYAINHERIITAISGNTITIDIPIVDVMEDQYGGGEISKASIPGRISNSGVENLRIESYFASDTDENHTWSAIRLSRAVNCWVKGVTGQYMGYGTVIIGSESNFNTIEECASIDHKSQITGGRRYSFTIKDGVGNLFQRCYTREGRHDFETGSRVTGPNVFFDCYSTNTHSDIGPHHRWATGILFDNIRGGQIRVQNRGSSGTGHGWVGNAVLFWNLLSYKSDIKVSSPKGGRNWGIGCSGITQNGDGFWEHWNNPVTPRSLYLQQLEDRLGTQAVDNVVIDEQKTGDIYSMLAAWAGEGSLVPGPADTTLSSIKAVEDAYVRGGTYGNDNFGTATQLVVKENAGTADNDRMSFIKFNLDSIPRSVSVAKIRLKVSNDDPGASHSLHETGDSWTETTVTWNNQPAAGTLIGTQTVPAIGEWIEFDVTTQVNNELGGDKNLSVRLSESTVGTYVTYHSLNAANADDQPELVYELSPLPILTATEDAYVRGGTYANDNFGTANQLIVKENAGTADNDRMSFIKFDLSSIASDVAVAKIRLKVNNDDPGASHSLHLTGDSWTESTITWNNQPAAGALIGTQATPLIGEWIEFDVTTQVNNELGGDNTLSVRLSESTVGKYVTYYSLDATNPDDHPQLVYELGTADSLSVFEDAYVRGGSNANANYGAENQVIVKNNSSSSYVRESYLKFDLTGISGTLASAKVRLKVSNGPETTATHSLRFVSDDSWSESTITWNNKPATGATLDAQQVPAQGQWIEFDVLAQAQTELNGDGILSLNLNETTSNNYVGYSSSEATNPDDRPQLVYTLGSGSMARPISSTPLSPTPEVPTYREFVTIYPNPSSGLLKVNYFSSEEDQLEVRLFNLSGQIVAFTSQPVQKGQNDFELDFSKNGLQGIHFLHLRGVQGLRVKKLIIR